MPSDPLRKITSCLQDAAVTTRSFEQSLRRSEEATERCAPLRLSSQIPPGVQTIPVDSALTLQDEDTQGKQVPEDRPGADTEPEEDVPEGDEDMGQEVINYQDIQVDHNSKVTSENEGQKKVTENIEAGEKELDDTALDIAEEQTLTDDGDEEEGVEEEEEEEEEELNEGIGEEDTEEEFQYMLTPSAARELMLELQDPVEVAKFVVETDDAAGFLRALRLLLHDGYISESQAYELKDAVAAQLRNLLMLQQVELSRALFETYQPQMEEANPDIALEELLFDPEPQPIDYYDYGNMLNQEDAAYGSSQVNLYEAYQEALEEESSQALAQIAEILAQRIAKGEISPEEGAKIMSKVVQLLPNSYWEGSEQTMSSEGMPSEFLNGEENGVSVGLSSQASEQDDDVKQDQFDDDDEAEEEEEDEEEDDDDEDTKPVIEENFEEELLEAGPDGVVKEIEEEDDNGQEDAAELEEEAENLAEELQDELKEEGGKMEKGESLKIQRPGGMAVVNVGPSNDVIDDKVRQDWKDMSLLLDKSIPEDVLRSLGLTFDLPKGGKETAKGSLMDRSE
ncbi:uncharacterized protein [Diadema setosum]|uniref:uncharacterized protein n=1 Tax=Diadema setosum TaxID=31175 RepID=UPI003B3A8AA4